MTQPADLEAAALAYASSVGWSPNVPPPPLTAEFDGRATLNPSLTQQTAIGSGKPWSGLLFTSNGVTIDNGRYTIRNGPTYVYAPGSGTNTRSELATNRPITSGLVDWYADSLTFPSNYSPPAAGGWGLLFQLGYPHRSGPPLGIDCTQAGMGVNRDAGLLTVINGYPTGAIQERSYNDPFLTLAQIQGKTVDIVCGVRWVGSAADPKNTTGWLEVDVRIAPAGFQPVYSRQATTTQQWLSGQGFPTTADDKIGGYMGPTLPSTSHTRRGLMRFTDKASAIASLG